MLKMLSGILPHKSGDILIKGKNLSQYTPKELAKIIAVLPQHSSQAFSYTVKETVSLGRYAHQKGWFQSWSGKDEEAVLNEVERGEDHALKAYKEAREKLAKLGRGATDESYSLVERQLQGVQANHDQVKALRDAARARS
ncbi:MAG: ATP-binding cassette domain-containing protein [Pseudomonas sp.]|uniref:ATP-binding cassette domain-containing protein n=1 Tax=Pseudomonas sp. TaxID=306 RepID=UPI0033149CBF